MSYVRSFPDLGRADLATAGGKGANLGELVRAGFPVPPGFVLLTSAYEDFVAAAGIRPRVVELAAGEDCDAAAAGIGELFAAEIDAGLRDVLLAAYAGLGDDAVVAVRSSATAEDLPEASFAGQQDTFLNVRGPDALLAAVRDCWASLWTARAIAYRRRGQAIGPGEIALAVVVQRMVAADAAGVMFTANPGNGRRDEVVISAAWGLGEAVVGGEVNTDDVVVRAGGRTVLSRTTADKAVQTVLADRGTALVEVPAGRRREPVLTDAEAATLAAYGVAVQEHFGAPQDIEWARADGEFALLQARPITALPPEEGPEPTDWAVPDRRAMYVRGSIVEQLPDPLTPLFAELIEFSVTRPLRDLFAEFVGPGVVRDTDVDLPTINGYAYYRYGLAAGVRLTLNTPRALPILRPSGPRSGLTRWRDRAHPRYAAQVAAWAGRALGELSDEQLLDGVAELLDAGTSYYTSVQTIIPMAAMSEVLFTRYYNALVRRRGQPAPDPSAEVFLLGYDSEPIRAEKSLYDLARWAGSHPDLATALLAGSGLEEAAPPGVDDERWTAWRARFGGHVEHYGHAIYNMDFVNAVPADEPGPLLETVRFYLRGQGNDPYVRQGGLAERREEAAAAVRDRLGPVRRAGFDRLLRWAQSVAPAREDALADIGLAWPQLRRMLHELGDRLVAAGAVDEWTDVFWLRRAEVLSPGAGLRAVVEARRRTWRGQRRATPPQVLPAGSLWDRMFHNMLPANAEEQRGPVLKGIAGSGGQVTGTARVLAGPADFATMAPGEILVASITTPAWTSLFARAAGVVTDVGGPLSHSSIVAREYGIPAVLGTGVATRRITSGQRIRVDGDSGTVTLLEE